MDVVQLNGKHCKKCGYDRVNLKYRITPEAPKMITRQDVIEHLKIKEPDEWLEATCDSCGYTWRIEVLEKG